MKNSSNVFIILNLVREKIKKSDKQVNTLVQYIRIRVREREQGGNMGILYNTYILPC